MAMCKRAEEKAEGCEFCPLYLADIDCVDYETDSTPLQQRENIAAKWAEYFKRQLEDA